MNGNIEELRVEQSLSNTKALVPCCALSYDGATVYEEAYYFIHLSATFMFERPIIRLGKRGES